MRFAFLAAAALLSFPAAATAQEGKPIDEAAADLAYGYCPLYLAQQFPLTGNPQLTELGFGATVQKQQHPRFGEIQTVEAKRADGELGFGGAAGKTCTVVVGGKADRTAVLARLRKNMSFMGLPFEPTEALTPLPAGFKVETFKAPVENQILYLQLIEAGGPTPVVMAQLFVTEK